MKSTRLLAIVMASMAASMSAASASIMRRGIATKDVSPPKTADASRTVGSSRNGGHRSGNRHQQRLALKKRNQQRHRRACRG
jgi:hypothetical protein